MQAQYSSKFSEIIQNLIKESKGELQDHLAATNTPLFNIFMLFTFVTSLFYYIISTYVNSYLHFA